MTKGGSVYSAQRTKPGTLLGGRKEQSQASYDDKRVDKLLDILLDMDEEDLNQLMQCDDSTTSGLLKSLNDMRGIDEDSIKQIKRLRDEGGNKKLEKSRAKGKNATDAMFSSAAANNYYQAIAYKIGAGSVASNGNDDASSKNISWKGLKEDASAKNYYKAIAHKKVASNDNVSTDDASVGMSTLKSGYSLTSLEETVAAAMKAGNTPVEVAEQLMRADSEKVDKRRTEKLVAEALKKNMTPTEIANYLMQAEETRKKEEEAKEAQRNIEKLVKEALKKGHTPSEVAEYLSRFGQENKEQNMNEQLVKDALKHGGNTPAEIAAFLLKADEEKRAQDLINEALKVCKSPKEIAEYLVKAEEDQRRAAAPPPPPPVKALSCHRKHDALSTTSSVSHLRSISSMASELSSECSIVTEIVNKGETKQQVDTSVEAPKKAGMKSTSSSLRKTKASTLQNKKAPKEKSSKQGISKKIGKDKKNKKAIEEKKETNGTSEELIDSVQLYGKVMLPDGSVKSEPVDVDSFMDESAEVSTGASGDSNEDSDSKMELVSVSTDGDNQEIALAATFNTGWGVVQQEDEPHEEIDVSLHDYKKVTSAKKSSPKMQSMISKAKSGFLGMRVKRPEAADKTEATSEKKKVKKGDLPPAIPSRADPPVSTVSHHSASEESSQLWDNITDEDESKGGKNRGSKSVKNDQKVKKSGATTKQVENNNADQVRASNSVAKGQKKESKFTRIMNFKKKSSSRKVTVHQKTSSSSSGGTSAGTETETQSSASGAKNEDKVSSVVKEGDAVDKDQDDSTSDGFVDGPVSSIDLMCSDGMSDDGVSLPSVLRDTKKISIWKEPSLLNKMRSDTSHPSMQSDNVNSKNTAETDSVTFVDDDYTERGGCVNSIRNINTEVQEYADEIALIARQFQDGLKSMYTGVVGCQFPQERELNGEFSEETKQLAENHLISVMMKGEDKQKEAVATVMEAAITDDIACDDRADELKRKREMYLSKLKKVSLNHI
jgi:hypothetical protein